MLAGDEELIELGDLGGPTEHRPRTAGGRSRTFSHATECRWGPGRATPAGGCKRQPQILERDFDAAVQEILPPSHVPSDAELFRDLMDRFTILAEACARFSQDVYRKTGTSIEPMSEDTVGRMLKITQSVFGKRSLEALAIVYMNRTVGVEGLKRALGPIRSSFLKMRLRQLEAEGLIQRDDASKTSDEARYSLTYKGQMIARLGEPVLLYLRLADGWRNPAPPATAHEDRESSPANGTAERT